MAIDSIRGQNFGLRKQETSTSVKRKVGMTATTLFPEDEVRETEESQARYQEYERIRDKMLTGEKLTAEEMRFLRQHYPEAAAKAERIQREMKMIRAQFQACDTAEETDQVLEKVRTAALSRFAQKDSTGVALLPEIERMHAAYKAQREQAETETEEDEGTASVPQWPGDIWA